MTQPARSSQAAPQPDARIDINHARGEELMKAPGMTRIWAERIVRFRPYRTKLELLEHRIVSGVVYDHIKIT
jgi:DNA uptake protein ComE-like DNA-binding protein